MKIIYKNKPYELVELKDVHQESSYDIIAIFEIQYVFWQDGQKCLAYEGSTETTEELRFVDYFYGASESINSIVEHAHEYIDKECDLQKLKMKAKKWKLAYLQLTRNEITLKEYEDIEHSLLGWVLKNVQVEEDVANCWSKEDLIKEMKECDIDLDSQASIRDFLTTKGIPNHIQIEIVRDMGFTPFEEENWR